MAYTDIDKPSDYFNTKLFTGNGSTNAITGVGFQPDWIWFKNRTQAQSHAIVDSVRGRKGLQSNSSEAEYTLNSGRDFGTFDNDGFTVLNPEQLNSFNYNNGSIVSWNWKAGTAVSGNTGGSGTAKAYSGSVNTDAGFSIVKYIGNGTAGHTIPHHLGAIPKMIMVKKNADAEWQVYHASIGNGNVLHLDTTSAVEDEANRWNDTTPTSSVFAIGTSGNVNANDVRYIAYCFSEKQGYSKFGSYTGIGNANGAFVYTGFKPAWFLVKRSNGSANWELYDNKRLGYNSANPPLYPDLSNAEGGSGRLDFLSNGVKMRAESGNLNDSGGSYIYMAFADQPLVTSTGVPATAR